MKYKYYIKYKLHKGYDEKGIKFYNVKFHNETRITENVVDVVINFRL